MRTSDRNLSPFLTLLDAGSHITATVTVCYDPCGWVSDHLHDSISVLIVATYYEKPKPSRKDIRETNAKTKGLCSRQGKDSYSAH